MPIILTAGMEDIDLNSSYNSETDCCQIVIRQIETEGLRISLNNKYSFFISSPLPEYLVL